MSSQPSRILQHIVNMAGPANPSLPCQQCGQPLDNTGTICNACAMQLLNIPGNLQPARPLLLGKATPVNQPYKIVMVEYDAKVLVSVDVTSGSIESVGIVHDANLPATGRLFVPDVQNGLPTLAGVPTPPPKFSSPEEADAWLEANAGKVTADVVEITQDEADKANQLAAGITWGDWI